jgi:tRNA(Arg) A34 adenosine deaminase TadA
MTAFDLKVVDMAMQYAIKQVHSHPGLKPFGAVVVDDWGDIHGIGVGTGDDQDPTCHSELLAIRMATSRARHVPEMTLVSTSEPCMMCCGAILHSKIGRVVWGSWRSDCPHLFSRKLSAVEFLSMTTSPPAVLGGYRRAECVDLLKGLKKWD